ncbi:MAG: hypothetical protein Q7T16_03475, partial [Candidatus Burarchaeum sp.]
TTALLSQLAKAMTFTVGSTSVSKSRLALPIDPDSLRSSMAADEKALETIAKKLDAADPSSAAANARDIARSRDLIASLANSEVLLLETHKSLEEKAGLAYDAARLSIKQLAELAPKGDKQYADELSSLSALLSDSSSALEDGRLLDSISLSNHIQSRTQKGLERIPSASSASSSLLSGTTPVLAVSLVFLAALIYLFVARKKPKEPAAPRKLVSLNDWEFRQPDKQQE